MARRDIFRNIKGAEADSQQERIPAPGYAARGASRNMLASIGELAEKAAKAEQYLQGASVVELDTALVDSSFVSDRMEDDDALDIAGTQARILAAVEARRKAKAALEAAQQRNSAPRSHAPMHAGLYPHHRWQFGFTPNHFFA